jgi:hypothetical protein
MSSQSPRSALGWFFVDSLTVTKRHVIKITRIPETLFFALIQPVMFVLVVR